MKARVIVTFKRSILDPQGKAVHQALQTMGYTDVKNVRMGKYIEMDLDPGSVSDVKKRVVEMSEKLLANTVIEEYRFEIEDE